MEGGENEGGKREREGKGPMVRQRRAKGEGERGETKGKRQG